MDSYSSTVDLSSNFGPDRLGAQSFLTDYGVRLAYVAGAMYQGIASKEMVVAMGKRGLLSFLGAGGLSPDELATALGFIQSNLPAGAPYGMNFIHHMGDPEGELKLAKYYISKSVPVIEASAFMKVTPGLVLYRASGLRRGPSGLIESPRRIMAKISRLEVAEAFMNPPPDHLVKMLVERGALTADEASLAASIPMACDICVEADSGGHTDQGVASVLLPAIMSLRDELAERHDYHVSPRVGAAGGIGCPQAAAAAFTMGADFILTGSINQCTVEAGTSDVVKDLLQCAEIHDTTYVPAADMFEIGAKVQVFKRGLLFPARANKLHEIYTLAGGIDDIDEKTRAQLEKNVFRMSLASARTETKAYLEKVMPLHAEGILKNSKQEMAWVFRWYFAQSTRAALAGDASWKQDMQVQCGPALGAFNRWVKGTDIADWRNRRVADIGEKLMLETADLLAQRQQKLFGASALESAGVEEESQGLVDFAEPVCSEPLGRFNDPTAWRKITSWGKAEIPSNIRSWLVGPRVISKALKERSEEFNLSLFATYHDKLDQHERRFLSLLDGGPSDGYFRQVVMSGGNRPFVFGHVVIPEKTYTEYQTTLEELGNRPFGETVLFAGAEIQRSPFKLALSTVETSRTILEGIGEPSSGHDRLWARQSIFWLGVCPILVREFFLPAIPDY